MNKILTKEQTAEILRALDEAIEEGPWEESSFLRVIGKNLREIREIYIQHIESTQPKTTTDPQEVNIARSGLQPIYIVLYSTDGSNLQSWERILVNLPRQVVSRPVYANENDAIQLIRSKTNKINEAYVIAYIDPSAVLPIAADKIPFDRLGKPLLVLKDRALLIENISAFIHQSGNYGFVRNHLIKKGD